MTTTTPPASWPVTVDIYANATEWREGRRNGIGASDLAALLGVGYADQSEYAVWASKVLGIEPNRTREELRRLNLGKRLEGVISDEFYEETGLVPYSLGEFTVLRSKARPHLSATLDRYCIHPGYGPIPVELKAVSSRVLREWETDDEPPKNFIAQVHGQMEVTGAPAAYLVGLIGVDGVIAKIVERNQRLIDAMMPLVDDLWDMVVNRTPPPPDDSEATSRVMSLVYRQDNGESIELPDDLAPWCESLAKTEKMIERLEARRCGCINKIKEAMGEASRAKVGDHEFTWKVERKSSIDVGELRQRFPEVAAQCGRQSEARVFRPKRRKKDK